MQHWKDFSTLPAFGLEVIVELEDNKIISVKLNSNNKDDKQNNTEDDKTQNNIDSDTKQDDIKSNETNNKPEIKEIPITDNSTINLDEEEKKPLEENKVTKVLDKVEIIKARGYIQVDKNIEECIYNYLETVHKGTKKYILKDTRELKNLDFLKLKRFLFTAYNNLYELDHQFF